MKDDQIDWSLLSQYFAGESDEVRRKVELWMEGDPLRREYIESLRTVWTAAGGKRPDWDVDSAWHSVASKAGIIPTEASTRELNTPLSMRKRSERWGPFLVRIAAAILLVGLPYLAFKIFFPDISPAPKAAMREVATAKGERATIRLSDGSSVLLNSASSIAFPERFSDNIRELSLQGEAYFNVAPATNKLFVVHAGDASIEVLGTEFNVRAWPEEKEIQVVVAKGRVAFRGKEDDVDRGVVLGKGERSDLSAEGLVSPPRRVDLSRYLDWMNGRLVFDNAPFDQVLRRLERQYNLTCSVADSSILRRHLTASFSSEPVEEVIRIISRTLNLRSSKKGNAIVFSAHPRRATSPGS